MAEGRQQGRGKEEAGPSPSMAEGRKGGGSPSMAAGRKRTATGVLVAARVDEETEIRRITYERLGVREMNRYILSYSHIYKGNKVIYENTCIWKMRKNG
jgi:hypothetical protein